ncbi:MAG: extracellular solute-binding protein [Aristaeellaceae bacterium]
MKKLAALVLAVAMIMSIMMIPASAEVTKPQKITIFIDGTVVTQPNGQAEFKARWEELSGIELEIIQPDHDAYYDVLQQQIASGDWPDVMILSSTYYAAYAKEGVLWDMTDAWEASATKNSGRLKNESVIEGLKIDGRLYGFADAIGGGCVTYIKKAWLDAVGMEAPTTWEEYCALCDAFVNGDPNKSGKADTYAVTAAGFIGTEAPYINYLPEFYQDAYPSFYQNEEGKWVDGFTEPAMKAALERLNEGYTKGWIDPTTLTNGTKDCRNKFYDDTTGIFTYWAGTWATNLKVNLENNNRDSELVAIAPLEGAPGYFDRTPPVWSISATCENPEGVFTYFIDTILDGGDMQFLWTYGVEGVHWSRAAETVLDVEYAEGQFHFLENRETPGTTYTKNHTDPVSSLAVFAEGYADPKDEIVQPENIESSNLFSANSRAAWLVPSTDVMTTYNGDLTTLKNSLIAKVAMGEMTYDDAMAEFAKQGQAWSDAIVESLNAQ